MVDFFLMNAHVAIEQGQADEAQSFLAKIDHTKLEAGLRAIYYSTEGQAQILLKNYAAGLKSLHAAIRAFAQDPLTTPLQIERVYNWIGLAYYEQGQIGQAIETHRRCLQPILDGQVKDDRFLAKICLNLGNDYLLAGQKNNALSYYRQAVNELIGSEDCEDLAGLYWAMGLAYRGLQNSARAKLYLWKSLSQYVALNYLPQAARVRNLLGLVMVERQEYIAARQNLLAAYATAEALAAKDYVTLASSSTNLALLYWRQQKYAEAEMWGQRSLDYAEKLGDRLQISQAQAQLAEVKLALGKEAETISLFDAAVATIEQTGVVEVAGVIYYRYSLALKQLEKRPEAYEMMTKAYRARTAKNSGFAPFTLVKA